MPVFQTLAFTNLNVQKNFWFHWPLLFVGVPGVSVTSSQVSVRAKTAGQMKRNQQDKCSVTLPARFIRLPCCHKQSGES